MQTVPQPVPIKQPPRITGLVGYGDLIEWARAATPLGLAYIYMQPEPRLVAENGSEIEAWTITVQQRAADGVLHYCRIPLLPITTIMAQEIEDLSMEYLIHVIRWLRAAHYDLIPGLFAVPFGAQLLDAKCTFIDWDPIGNNFIRTDGDTA